MQKYEEVDLRSRNKNVMIMKQLREAAESDVPIYRQNFQKRKPTTEKAEQLKVWNGLPIPFFLLATISLVQKELCSWRIFVVVCHLEGQWTGQFAEFRS